MLVVLAHRIRNRVAVDCLDAKSGTKVWRKEFQTAFRPGGSASGNSGPRPTPTIDGGHVYFGTTDGMVAALELEDGNEDILKLHPTHEQDKVCKLQISSHHVL